MNDTRPGTEEQELRRLLRQRAALASPSPHARAALQARLEQAPKPSRVRRRIAVAAAAAAAGLGLLTQGTSPVVVTADGGAGDRTTEDVSTPTTTAPEAGWRPFLPRLALGDGRFTVEHREEHQSDGAVDTAGQIHAQVFRGASGGPASPSLTVRSIAPGVAYGIGEEAPTEVVERIDVNGRTGYLVGSDALSPSLGIRFDDGSAVHLKAIGMPGQAVVEIARTMVRRTGAPGWDLATSSLPPVVEGEVRYGGSRSSEIQYVGPSGARAGVRLFDGDRLRYEDIVLDRADAAVTYEPVEVRGHPGVLFGTGDSFVALWHEDGIVGEVSLTLDRTGALAALASLQELSEEQWQALPTSSGRG